MAILTRAAEDRTFDANGDFNRESPRIEIDTGLPPARAIRALDELAHIQHGKATREDDEFVLWLAPRLEAAGCKAFADFHPKVKPDTGFPAMSS